MMTMKEWEAMRVRFESAKPHELVPVDAAAYAEYMARMNRTPRHWEAANNTCRPRADDMESVWASYNAAQVGAEQRRMIKTGVALALSILLGIGVGVGLERGWTAMNAEVAEVAK